MTYKTVNFPRAFIENLINERLNVTETRIVLFIAFHSWGIDAEYCPLSYGYISKELIIDERTTKRTIKSLKERHIIKNYQEPGTNKSNLWGIDNSYCLIGSKPTRTAKELKAAIKDETRIMNHRHDESMAAVPDRTETSPGTKERKTKKSRSCIGATGKKS